jgi:hypothetical protein
MKVVEIRNIIFHFTENQISISHDIVRVKNISFLIEVVLEAALVLFVKSGKATGCQTSKSLRPGKRNCNVHR